MAKSWQQILIERLINDEVVYPNGNKNEFKLLKKPIFSSSTDHQEWFYGNVPFHNTGLKKFAAGSNKKAVEEDVRNHTGYGATDKLTKEEEEQVSQLVFQSGASALFSAPFADDIFNAVRAKILKVYEEGKIDGAGLALFSLGEKFAEIVAYIKRTPANFPTDPVADFETMLLAITHDDDGDGTPDDIDGDGTPDLVTFFAYMAWTERFGAWEDIAEFRSIAKELNDVYDEEQGAPHYHTTY